MCSVFVDNPAFLCSFLFSPPVLRKRAKRSERSARGAGIGNGHVRHRGGGCTRQNIRPVLFLLWQSHKGQMTTEDATALMAPKHPTRKGQDSQRRRSANLMTCWCGRCASARLGPIRCANDHAIGNSGDDWIGAYRAKGTIRSARSPLRRFPSSRLLSPRPCKAAAPKGQAFCFLNYSRPGRCFALIVRRPTGPTSMNAMKTRLNSTNPNGTPTGSSGAGPAAWRSCLTDAAARRERASHAELLGGGRTTGDERAARRPRPRHAQWQPPDHRNDRRGADALARCRPRGTRQCGRRPPLAGTPPQRRTPPRGTTRLPSLLPSLRQCSTRRR